MYKNTNREVVRELARDNYHAHQIRNFIAILAIVLTTVLVTAVLTVGISYTSTVLNYGESAPGPGCEGGVRAAQEKRAQIEALAQVDYADYIEKCSSAAIRNKAVSGMQVWLMAPEAGYYGHNYVDLLDGAYPAGPEEILISDTLAKKFRLTDPVGKKLTLEMLFGQGDEAQESAMEFTVCGYFKNPLIAIENTYDEIYTTPEFRHTYNPGLRDTDGLVYVKLNNLNPLLLKSDVEKRLGEVSDAVGAKGYSTKYTSSLFDSLYGVLPALLFVLLIILSGYFLIYNVFFISVTSDIRWFGMLKTIGTTPHQVKQILMWQIRRLAFAGILIGVIAGYLVGDRLGPGVISDTIYGPFYRSPNPVIVGTFGAVFSWITVWISGQKSMKTASEISPVEAARYAPKKKIHVFTVISLALSGIIFIVACNAALGYSVDRKVERYDRKDAQIRHSGSIWWLNTEMYQPISEKLVRKLGDQPFVTDIQVVYTARTFPDYMDVEGSAYYMDSLARVKLQGKLKEWAKQYETLKDNASYFSEGDANLKIRGIPARSLTENIAYETILEGSVDERAFASGDYILWQDWNVEWFGITGISPVIHAGDTISIPFYDDEIEDYVEKTVTVMAVVKNDDMFGTGDITSANIVMPDTLFQKIYPDYQDKISSITIDTEKEITGEEHKKIQELLAEEYNPQLQLDSRYLTRIEEENSRASMMLIGMFLSVLLGVIGISNLVNTIATGVLARKHELATLQSIGMTKTQLFQMLFWETGKFVSSALVIMLPAGGFLAGQIAKRPTFTGFSMTWFLVSSAMVVGIILLVAVIVIAVLVSVLNQRSIVERLREIE